MLMPHPESDLKQNTLVLGAEILYIMKENGGSMLTETLIQSFLNTDVKRTPDTFLETISFLFTCGFITQEGYRLKTN